MKFLLVRALGASTGVSGGSASISNQSEATNFIVLLLDVPTGEPGLGGL